MLADRSDDGPEGRLQAIEARLAQLEATVARLRATEPGPRFAAIYPGFQDRFRGSEADITAKLSAYLPDVDRLVSTGGVVDVGPGRGEWLALLAERGVSAHGVDTHRGLAEACRGKGLEVVLADAATHLSALAPGSVDMVTAFHVIEHLGVEELIELIDSARRALRPGGCLLFETPNPTNLIMGACDFYNDPTHRSPLPPDLTAYLISAHGFRDIEVRHLHPKKVVEDDDQVGVHLYGPQDYAVLGLRED
jgi:2-polyprenyl-3-methyl-5-hydroxy-6-metoxy-1,4-benzoquinol methylase